MDLDGTIIFQTIWSNGLRPVCNVDLDGTIMDPNRDAVMPIVTPEQVESIINNSNTNKDAGKRIGTEHDWRD